MRGSRSPSIVVVLGDTLHWRVPLETFVWWEEMETINPHADVDASTSGCYILEYQGVFASTALQD